MDGARRAASGTLGGAAEAAVISDEKARELGEACRRVMVHPAGPLSGLAVVLIAGGRIVWEGYFGARRFADDDRSGDLPVDERTRWRVASISKPVVALGAMRLVEQGSLDLDRDISDYLGWPLRNPSFPDKAITARMLFGHTSSLRDADFYYPPLGHTLRDLLVPEGRYWDKGRHFAAPSSVKDRSPGICYSYCNLGYGIMGSMIEKLTGKRFDLYMKDTIFDPLRIDGGFNPNLLSDEGFSRLSPIYRKCPPQDDTWNSDGPWYPQVDDYGGVRPKLPVRIMEGEETSSRLEDYRLGENGSLFSPQGGMRICARDLAKIAQLLIGGGEMDPGFGPAQAGGAPRESSGPRRGRIRIVSEESVAAMMTPGWKRRRDGSNCEEEHSRVYATGIGLMRQTGPGGGPALWGHRGNAYGFLGGLFADRKSGSGYVYMIGGTGTDPDSTRDPASGLSVWEDALGGAIERAFSWT